MPDFDVSNIVTLRIEKESGLFVNLRHGIVYCYSGWQVINDQQIDLTSHVPTTGARVTLICLGPSGAVELTDGITRGNRASVTDRDTPIIPERCIPLACVVLEAGQTELRAGPDMTDIGDLRNLVLAPFGAGGSGGGGSGVTELSQLSDVSVISRSDGQVLYWNATSGLWEAKTVVDYTGPKITVSTTEPTSPSAGDLWVDIS